MKYEKHSEGSYYLPTPGRGAAVAPHARFTYVWELDEAAGPLPDEPSSKAWLYHSHVVGDDETNLGLIGAIIVTDPKRARPDGTPRDVDREFAMLFMIFDESDIQLRITNADEFGVIRGGQMEFELVLDGTEWPATKPAGQKLPVAVDVARAHHVAAVIVR